MIDHELILTTQIDLMALSGVPLSNYFAEDAYDLFDEPSKEAIQQLKRISISNIYSLKYDNNAMLKAFAVGVLRIIFQNKKNQQLCQHIKCSLYSDTINLNSVINTPYPTLHSKTIKKLFVQFFQILKYGSNQNKIYLKMNRYPIMLQLFVIYLRVILSQFSIPQSLNYQSVLPLEIVFDSLIQFFDLDVVRLTNLYLLRGEDVFILCNDNKEYVIGNYGEIKNVESIRSSKLHYNSQFIQNDDSDEEFIFEKRQRQSQIITPHFQPIQKKDQQNQFQKRKSSFHNKEKLMRDLGKISNNDKPSVFEQLENSISIDKKQLWNKPLIQSEGDQQEIKDKANQLYELPTHNPEKNYRSKMVESIQLNFNQLEKNNQSTQLLNSDKILYQQKQLQQSLPQKTFSKHQQKKQKWYPFKRNKNKEFEKSKQVRQINKNNNNITKLYHKNTIDSDYFQNESNSTSFQVTQKQMKNTLVSNVVNLIYYPQRKQNNIYKNTVNHSQKKSILILKQSPSVINHQLNVSNIYHSRLVTQKQPFIPYSPRIITKSPLNYRQQLYYPPQNILVKPKVSFIYKQPVNRQIGSKSTYYPWNK